VFVVSNSLRLRNFKPLAANGVVDRTSTDTVGATKSPSVIG